MLLFLLLVSFGQVYATPPLVTVQDVIYKADGSKFIGVAIIAWNTFQASDGSAVAAQTITVQVVDGNLRVRLIPTANASTGARYRVRFTSEGRVLFTEQWNVPPSTGVLRLRDVRSQATGNGGTVGGVTAGQVAIVDVDGLPDALDARPVKGFDYSPGRVLMVGTTGSLESVSGDVADCVKVDGSAGPCGSASTSSGPSFVDAEVPAGTVNGSNTVFTLSNTPSPASSLQLFRNGVFLKAGLDFTLAGNTLQMSSSSVPVTDDTLLASYRIADPNNPPAVLGGMLSGSYTSAIIAAGVITNSHISASAGIHESKLSLGFPTHSNVNDPAAAEKAAMTGTAGVPSSSNKFVTDQDSRLTNARTPSAHSLLSDFHSDTIASVPLRGDLAVAQGGSNTKWVRLPLGASDRCLTSNGSDAVWNTCLFTGFPLGALPFVDASGSLTHNAAKLTWDNTNRRLSLGNNLGQATLYVYDSHAAVGSTTLAVRAGQGQSNTPIQKWMNASGTQVAQIDDAGALAVANISTASSSTRAALRDPGTATDPSSRSDGDLWHNSSTASRRTQEASQVHSLPQVICSTPGTNTVSASTLTILAACSLPAGLVQAGDRFEIQYHALHSGSARAFTVQLTWGNTVLVTQTGPASESLLSARASVSLSSTNSIWSAQSWGATLSQASAMGQFAPSLLQAGTISFSAQLQSSGSDTVSLHQLTVVRIPTQINP